MTDATSAPYLVQHKPVPPERPEGWTRDRLQLAALRATEMRLRRRNDSLSRCFKASMILNAFLVVVIFTLFYAETLQ